MSMAASSSDARPPTGRLSPNPRPKTANSLALDNYVAHVHRLAQELAKYERPDILRSMIDQAELWLDLLDDR